MMTIDKANQVFKELDIEPTAEIAVYALQDFQRARESFTEEEYSDAEHKERIAAALEIIASKGLS